MRITRVDKVREGPSSDGRVSRVDYYPGPTPQERLGAHEYRRIAVDGTPTRDGFVRCEAVINGCGVYVYSNGFDSWGELRLREFVHAPKVLKSWAMMPVTDDHPTEMVDSTNVGLFQKGSIGSNVRPIGDDTAADLILTHDALIAKFRKGKTQVSCGYRCRVVAADDPEVLALLRVYGDELVVRGPNGTFRGQPFRYVQLDYEPNHVAIVDKARGGPSCRVWVADVAWAEGRDSGVAPLFELHDWSSFTALRRKRKWVRPTYRALRKARPAIRASARATKAYNVRTRLKDGFPVDLSKALTLGKVIRSSNEKKNKVRKVLRAKKRTKSRPIKRIKHKPTVVMGHRIKATQQRVRDVGAVVSGLRLAKRAVKPLQRLRKNKKVRNVAHRIAQVSESTPVFAATLGAAAMKHRREKRA